MIILYTTIKTKKEAIKISKELINKNVVICTNFFPINSIYKWKKKVVSDKEYGLILKAKTRKAIKMLKKLHPYKTPFIGIIDMKVNKDYLKFAFS